MMEQSKSASKIRNKMFYEFNNDGILEIIAGSSIYFRLFTNDGSSINSLFFICFFLFLFLRKNFTSSRIGNVTFNERTNFKKYILLALTSYLLIFIIFAVVLFNNLYFMSIFLLLATLLFFLLIAILIDYHFGFRRVYLIFLLFFIGTVISPFLTPYLGSRFCNTYLSIFPGSILIVYGLFLLLKFLIKYPQRKQYGQ